MDIQIIKNKNKTDYKNWSIWECPPKQFEWTYDQEEHCFIIEGNVIVETINGSVEINKNDYVIFSKGLKCNWDVKKSIIKYYTFK